MSKPKYFDYEKFIDQVLAAMKLGKTPAPVLMELREAIETRLSDRIVATIFSSFGTKEMQLFEKLLKDHQELDEIDILFMVVPNIKGLDEKLKRNINALFSELTYDAEKIEEAINSREEAKK